MNDSMCVCALCVFVQDAIPAKLSACAFYCHRARKMSQVECISTMFHPFILSNFVLKTFATLFFFRSSSSFVGPESLAVLTLTIDITHIYKEISLAYTSTPCFTFCIIFFSLAVFRFWLDSYLNEHWAIATFFSVHHSTHSCSSNVLAACKCNIYSITHEDKYTLSQCGCGYLHRFDGISVSLHFVLINKNTFSFCLLEFINSLSHSMANHTTHTTVSHHGGQYSSPSSWPSSGSWLYYFTAPTFLMGVSLSQILKVLDCLWSTQNEWEI